MEDGHNYLRELLEKNGWYKRWYTQVMADILLPHVAHLAQPEKNALLARFKEEENNMLALYMVKEFLKTVGLPSTAKIFETEAGLFGIDQDYSQMIQEHFTLLKPSTPHEVYPPLLSQALHIWKVEAVDRVNDLHTLVAEGGEKETSNKHAYKNQASSVLDRIRRGSSASSARSSELQANNFGQSLDQPKHQVAMAAGGNQGNVTAVYQHYTTATKPTTHVSRPMSPAESMAAGGGGHNVCRRNRSLNCKRCN